MGKVDILTRVADLHTKDVARIKTAPSTAIRLCDESMGAGCELEPVEFELLLAEGPRSRRGQIILVAAHDAADGTGAHSQRKPTRGQQERIAALAAQQFSLLLMSGGITSVCGTVRASPCASIAIVLHSVTSWLPVAQTRLASDSVVPQVKGNLGSGNHAFAKQQKHHRP